MKKPMVKMDDVESDGHGYGVVMNRDRVAFVRALYREHFCHFYANLVKHLDGIAPLFRDGDGRNRGWDHVRIPLGGYMRPTGHARVDVIIQGDNTAITLTPDALGMVVCIVTLLEMGAERQFDWMRSKAAALQARALHHNEKAAIFQVVLLYRSSLRDRANAGQAVPA